MAPFLTPDVISENQIIFRGLKMKCCVNCFVDKKLVCHIEENGEDEDCEFCKAENVKTMDAAELADVFEQLLNLYEPAEAGAHYIPEDDEGDFGYDGISLAEQIENDWSVFSDELEMKVRNEILDEILYGNMRPKDRLGSTSSSDWWAYKKDSFYERHYEKIWTSFAYHLRRTRRFLLKDDELEPISNPMKWLPNLLQHVSKDITTQDVFYRARIGGIREPFGKLKPFPADKMTPPDAENASRGRANPAGIAYLYVADKEKTAVLEVQPFLKEQVTIAKLSPQKNLRVVDLTKIHKVSSPFFQEDLEDILYRNALLNTLNFELARPVKPSDNEVEYVPTQYLAEAILNCGYDGIRYRSSMSGDGTNFVFFSSKEFNINAKTKLVEIVSRETVLDYR